MDLKEAKELLKEGIVNSVGNKKTGMAESCKEYQEAISTILQELDNLQKENEELKDIDLTTVHIKGVCDEKKRWRNKIKEKIEEINKLLPNIDYRDIEDKQEREYYKKEYYKVVAERNILQNLLKE